MKTKYFNDAIIGNNNMLASYSSTGELLRLYYPSRDNKQFIDFFETGVKVNDSSLIYLAQDVNNLYKQKYIEDTNILTTEIKNTYFNLKVVQTDFISIKENILIKRYVFTNENTINLDVKFFIHSKLHSGENNLVGSKLIENGISQYSHDFALNIFSNKVNRTNHQLNDTGSNIQEGYINDKDYIGMSADSSVCYDLGSIKPGEKKNLDIIINITSNNEKEIETSIKSLKKLDILKEQAKAVAYWEKYLKKHDTIKLVPKNKYEEKIKNIYKRTILLFPLLQNSETGGISAAVEVDEERKKCGRYSYCWTRDAVFITEALDILEMNKETEKFYKIFCKITQSDNGMWEQRFYTDGTLAPCWGYQIDETASVIYGTYKHYESTKDKKFLKDTLKMCEKAYKYLNKYIEDILSEEESKMHVSYDLWEMHEGTSMYSISSIFAAFNSMDKIYDELYEQFEENRIKQENIRREKKNIEDKLVKIKKYLTDTFYDLDKKSFVRNNEDKWMDISLLGAVVPFEIFTPKEKKVLNTVEKIDMTLRTYTSGYKRFENDNYMNGNPWTIATLWMALYHIKKGERNKAREELKFVVQSATELGLIAEQVDNNTLKPNWVIGLGWAHAMFITVLNELYGKR